jgi:hypothetical protein
MKVGFRELLLRNSLCFLFIIFFTQSAFALSIKQTVKDFKVVPLNYGANNLKVGDKNFIITKGAFENGNAWGADVYFVLVKQKDSLQFVRLENIADLSQSIAINNTPHTGEDSVKSVYFLTSKNALYLLVAKRPYKAEKATIVTFTLHQVILDADFDIFYFKELAQEKSLKEYISIEKAIVQELGL